MTREADPHPLLAARGSAAAPVRASSSDERPGEGVSDADELARILRVLRQAEAGRPDRRPDVMIGEFTVEAWRVPPDLVALLRQLTRTEAAVLRFMGWGRANADIATLLNINDNTVRTHMTNAIRKLDVDGARGLNSLAGLLFHPVK